MKISQEGIDLIKKFEGLKTEAYQDIVGVWTLGYGSTSNVKPGDTLTEEECEALLIEDLARFEQGVTKLVTVPLNQHQYDALVSFSFNLGLNALRNSTLLRKLNEGDYIGAEAQFEKWCMAGGKPVAGLLRRRKAEAEEFGESE